MTGAISMQEANRAQLVKLVGDFGSRFHLTLNVEGDAQRLSTGVRQGLHHDQRDLEGQRRDDGRQQRRYKIYDHWRR